MRLLIVGSGNPRIGKVVGSMNSRARQEGHRVMKPPKAQRVNSHELELITRATHPLDALRRIPYDP